MRYNTEPSSEAEQHSISGPLFDEEPLDLETHGGLVVLDTAQIAEVTPLKFIPESDDPNEKSRRIELLPFDIVDGEDGSREIRWREPEAPYDPERLTIGLETESLTMEASNAEWWEISPDGRKIHYPHGLAVEPAHKRGHQPELLKNTTESGSPVENLSRGFEDFITNAADEKYFKQVWGVENGLKFPPISVYPESVRREDITEHPYTQMLTRIMPRVLEYASGLSEQLNIQWKNPEAGAFALNGYQILGPVLGLVTAASPARDGSLHTTLSQHYEHNPDFAAADNAEDYQELARLVRAELGEFMDTAPYDWRELVRGYGSPGGGVITKAAQPDLESLLRDADQQLRRSEVMTVNRVLGTHADRWRPDKGVVEVSNLSLGGDHPDKMLAAEETVIKTIVALQEYYDDPQADTAYNEAWSGIIPSPDERDDMDSRQRFVDAARVNTMLFTLFGKDRNMFDANWNERAPEEIFAVFADFIGRYAPKPLTDMAHNEIWATLQVPPVFKEPQTINDPLASFFGRESNLTATEAIRMAEPLDDMNPPISLSKIMRRFADFAYRKRMERHAAQQDEQAVGGAQSWS